MGGGYRLPGCHQSCTIVWLHLRSLELVCADWHLALSLPCGALFGLFDDTGHLTYGLYIVTIMKFRDETKKKFSK